MSFQTDLPCAATGSISEQRCLHHVYTRGSRPDLVDKDWNLMPLIKEAHHLAHSMGLSKFVDTYPRVRVWLLANGWEWDTFNKKWINRRAYELNLIFVQRLV